MAIGRDIKKARSQNMITDKNSVDGRARWSNIEDPRARSIAEYTAPTDEQAMRPYPVRPSFLVGMAMVFGFGAPLSNRLIDRLTVRKQATPADDIAESWRVVGQDFGAVLEAPTPNETPKSDRGSEE